MRVQGHFERPAAKICRNSVGLINLGTVHNFRALFGAECGFIIVRLVLRFILGVSHLRWEEREKVERLQVALVQTGK